MSYFSIRTDLAIEITEMLTKETPNNEIDGVEIRAQESEDKEIALTWVKITNNIGEKAMGKPKGNYITLESNAIKENNADIHERIIKILGDKLAHLCKLKKEAVILVVGLGNRQVTPDALGPKVISKVLVTRHIKDTVPEEIDNSVRSVCAIAPGVMGTTGIETGDVIKSLVDSVKPDIVVAIDALAARKSNRINSTIQITDTGIAPGAGVGNKRMMLNKETLGIPVIAIGVPTVVDAATLVNDTMDNLIDMMLKETKKGGEFYEMLKELNKEEKYQLIMEILDPYTGNMFVTPKEVDAVIERLSNIIANAINIAVHPGITSEDINKYFN